MNATMEKHGNLTTEEVIKKYKKLEKELLENHKKTEFLKRRLNELSLK